MPRVSYTFKDLAEVADEIETKAKTEDLWAERARKASDREKAVVRAAAFREVVAMLQNAKLG
jgi:hypothetical protein